MKKMKIKLPTKNTPFFLYNIQTLRRQINIVKNCFASYKNFELYFAMKANNNKVILREIIKNGLGLHVSTIQELKLAQSLKCKKISYTAPIIKEEIIQLQKIDNFEINLNNKSDFNLLPSDIKNIGIRINPLIGWSETKKTKAGGKFSQFGIPIDELDTKILQKITGLHCHTSSDSFKQSIYINQLKKLLKLAKKNKRITSINIGGGIGVPIWKNEKIFNMPEFSEKIIKTLNDFNKNNSTPIKLKLEIGNYLVRESGLYICKVIQTEKKFGRKFIFTNGTTHHLRGICPDSANYITGSKKTESSTIIGCTCQRDDILFKSENIPFLKKNDLILISNTGAYCSSQADNFHLIPKPKEYFNNKNLDYDQEK